MTDPQLVLDETKKRLHQMMTSTNKLLSDGVDCSIVLSMLASEIGNLYSNLINVEMGYPLLVIKEEESNDQNH